MPNRAEVQSLFLGPTGNLQSFNEDPTAFPYPGMVGQVMRLNDRWYQLVQFHVSCAPAAASGQMAYWVSAGGNVVATSPDLSLGADKDIGRNFPAGLIVGAPSRGYLGYIQKSGQSYVPVFSCTIGRPGDQAICNSVGIANITSGHTTADSSYVRVGVYKTSTAAISAMAYVDLLLRNYEV